MGKDRLVRIFRFATGKLYRTYDESLQVLNDMQKADLSFRDWLTTYRLPKLLIQWSSVAE